MSEGSLWFPKATTAPPPAPPAPPLPPSLRLTDEERAALERVCVAYELLPTVAAKQVADTLSNLLARLA